MADLVPLGGCDPQAIEHLLDDAFGVDRHGRTAYRIREGTAFTPHLSFGLMEEGATLVGSIQCWPVALIGDHGRCPLLLVGPVAVRPDRQNMGLGHRLMNTMLAASLRSDPAMVMIGDPEYYERFGFYARGTQGWELPGPWEQRRLLLRNAHHAPLPATGHLGPCR